MSLNLLLSHGRGVGVCQLGAEAASWSAGTDAGQIRSRSLQSSEMTGAPVSVCSPKATPTHPHCQVPEIPRPMQDIPRHGPKHPTIPEDRRPATSRVLALYNRLIDHDPQVPEPRRTVSTARAPTGSDHPVHFRLTTIRSSRGLRLRCSFLVSTWVPGASVDVGLRAVLEAG